VRWTRQDRIRGPCHPARPTIARDKGNGAYVPHKASVVGPPASSRGQPDRLIGLFLNAALEAEALGPCWPVDELKKQNARANQKVPTDSQINVTCGREEGHTPCPSMSVGSIWKTCIQYTVGRHWTILFYHMLVGQCSDPNQWSRPACLASVPHWLPMAGIQTFFRTCTCYST
jgi:hypothetical protein